MKIVLLYSGGLDSTTMLYEYLQQGHHVHCLAVDYGQTHIREVSAAYAIATEHGCTHELVDIDPAPFSGNSLTTGGVGVVVPNRNMFFLSIAAAVALRDGYDAVAIGCNASDYDLWPDCRPKFLDAMQAALFACDNRQITLLRPYVRETKLDIVKRALAAGVPIERTWSCYAGGTAPCGECEACVGRREALFLAGA
jgi:7-cyano-7-deazaguanine synthase